MTLSIVTHSEDETIALAARVGATLRAGDCIALIGDLGAGKTRFVRGLATGMGIDPARVHSPTFVVANVYAPIAGAHAAKPQPLTLVHADAHRLQDLSELEALGWDRLTSGAAALAIEWADRVAAALPMERLDVRIDHAGEHSRRLTLSALGEGWTSRISALGSSR